MSIDLHTHSTASDGTMSPADLVKYAHKKGLSAIAITDHDTIDGLTKLLLLVMFSASRLCQELS